MVAPIKIAVIAFFAQFCRGSSSSFAS